MLTALTLLLCVVALLALPAWMRAWAWLRAGAALSMAGCAGLGLLALHNPMPAQPLPIGPPWGAMLVGLDAISGFFLLALGLAGAATALTIRPAARAELLALPPLLLGLVLTAVAADGFTLILGIELAWLAAWAGLHDRRAARLLLVVGLAGAACWMGALGLLSAGAGSLGFAALRAAPPEGLMAAGVMALALLGTVAKLGLLPLHLWPLRAATGAHAPVAALIAGALPLAGLLCALRLLLELAGPVPGWWGLPLLLLGAATALLQALRALLEARLPAIFAAAAVAQSGLIAVALGLSLLFRAADMAMPAALALTAALQLALHVALAVTVLLLGARALALATGTDRPDAMGGLLQRMPALGGAMLLAGLSLAALPPLAGFAGAWLLVQAMLSVSLLADAPAQFMVLAAMAGAGMAMALLAGAMLRALGLALLGRPRSPRVAGAEEPPGPARAGLLVPAALLVVLGLLPVLGVALARPVLLALGLQAAPPAGLLGIGAGDAGAWYPALPLALALGGLGWALGWAAARRAPAGLSQGPAWDGGQMAPPAHMVFGDAAMQPSAAGLAQPVGRLLGAPLLGWREHLSPAEARVTWRDPFRPLVARLAALRHIMAAGGERLREPAARQAAALALALLLALLAGLAMVAQP